MLLELKVAVLAESWLRGRQLVHLKKVYVSDDFMYSWLRHCKQETDQDLLGSQSTLNG